MRLVDPAGTLTSHINAPHGSPQSSSEFAQAPRSMAMGLRSSRYGPTKESRSQSWLATGSLEPKNTSGQSARCGVKWKCR